MSRPVFCWPVRVYWEDTDAGGVVYHAGYLRFFERARTEWFRSHGIVQSKLIAEQNLLFVVYAMQVRFIRPARLDDLLEVRLGISALTRTRMVIEHDLHIHGGPLLSQGTAEVACLHANSFKPRSIPDDLAKELQA